jgi:phosphomannomutase
MRPCRGRFNEAQQTQKQKDAGMTRKYFGTDGIRGTVGQPPITPDFVLRLAHAVGRVLKRSEARPTVLIGKDTRISGYMLESALESGFNSAGVDVLLLGPVPTPAVAYLTRAQRASLGVVISASHNPFADNGIKFFSAMGTKLPDDWELAVEAALEEAPVWADSANLGKTRRMDDASGRYIEFCKSTCSHLFTLKGLKIVVDGANGAAYHIAPDVFHELGAEVIKIGCAPDGLNINQGVGATHPQALVGVFDAGDQLAAFDPLALQHLQALQLAADAKGQLGFLGGLEACGELAHTLAGGVFHGEQLDQARCLLLGSGRLVASGQQQASRQAQVEEGAKIHDGYSR